MKIAPCYERAFLSIALLAALSGCAARQSTRLGDASLEEAMPVEEQVASTEANTANAVAEQDETFASASTRVLLSEAENGLALELVDGTGANDVVIGSQVTDSSYKISRLHNPERVVVDLLGKGTAVSRVFETVDAPMVRSIRVGAHPDKNRIVMDLPEGEQVQYTSRIDNGTLIVSLRPAGEAAAAIEADSTDESTSTQAALIDDSGASEMEQAQVVADSRSSLSELLIESSPTGGNMVVATVNGRPSYTLEKTAPTEYVLRIKDAVIGDAAPETLLAPPGAGVIRSARPVQDGNDLLVRVFAAPRAELASKQSGDQIILGSFGTDTLSDEARAQPAPPAPPAAREEGAAAPAAAGAAGEANGGETFINADVSALLEDENRYTGRLISLDLQDTDIDNALRIIAEVSNLNIIASEDVTGKITLRLTDVPWDQALDVILKTNGLDKVQEGNVIRIAPVEKLRQEREALKQARIAEIELEDLEVEYIRVSYARAAELKPLVESVLSERGQVAYDERTNQLIVKDIRSGVKNVARLVGKLDLRTPQILLETQIVEATRSFSRDLGAELDFDFIASPQTGNALGSNFPNSVVIGGGGTNINNNVSSFPAAIGGPTATGSALSIALGSADGTRSLSALLSALESEGRVRVVSRPSVATTNNREAIIKSVTKFRIKLPSGGLSVATGSGASASGGGNVATETVEVGIILEVTPQASPDYYVLLDIFAKSSNLGPALGGDQIPSEIERSATSSVLVSSGQTFAMGGIYKISDDNDLSGVPFLKDVPVLGHFFRRTEVANTDEELLFFITPRIIEGSFDDAAMRIAS